MHTYMRRAASCCCCHAGRGRPNLANSALSLGERRDVDGPHMCMLSCYLSNVFGADQTPTRRATRATTSARDNAAGTAMHATWSIAAAGASAPRPTVAAAPRVAPRVMKAADLLSFERQGYWLDRGLLVS